MGKVAKNAIGLCLITFCFGLSIYAQDSGEVKVYRNQFVELRGKVKSVFERAEKQGKENSDYKLKLELNKEIFALVKLTHNLQEQADEANLADMKRGEDQNKTLLLVAQGCIGLDFVLNSLDDYISTDDRSFLSIAKDGNFLIESIEKVL